MTDLFRALRASLFAFALGVATFAAAEETPSHERLTRIARAYIDAVAAEDPITATALGLPGADGRLAIASEATRAGRIACLRAWKAEVDANAAGATTLVDANDAVPFAVFGPELLADSTSRRARSGPRPTTEY